MAGLCVGYVVADLAALCREATLRASGRAMSKGRTFAGMDDFVWAHAQLTPSTQRETVLALDRSVSWEDIGGQADAKLVRQMWIQGGRGMDARGAQRRTANVARRRL